MSTRRQTTPIIIGARKRTMHDTVRQITLRQTADPLIDDPELALIDPEFDSGAETFYAETGIARQPRERFF